ncbi:MAG TPA: hypothetical protein VL285_01125 [Bryobacteraceae bacterium]|nr:hypothetical protein [Bryobacteraceae bacterium]
MLEILITSVVTVYVIILVLGVQALIESFIALRERRRIRKSLIQPEEPIETGHRKRRTAA